MRPQKPNKPLPLTPEVFRRLVAEGQALMRAFKAQTKGCKQISAEDWARRSD